jgi:hypothetical protein
MYCIGRQQLGAAGAQIPLGAEEIEATAAPPLSTEKLRDS